ncbi:MAG: thiamine pyrophosphate-binding protein [Rhodobacteraceae bacterium]|nr:thiamine pyrophosphate-binding protein [Paracoccaceae bacterium]
MPDATSNTTTGARLLVDCLINLGARKCFGVPGESFLDVLDALHDTPGRLDFVLCRQEGGASFAAAAWGKLTGQPGIAFVTRGPGATNAAIGIHTAMQDSTPMIVFVGQIETGMRDREAFQELDYRAVFGPIAKWATEIDHADRVPELVSRAWVTATTGRPGPVVVALPEDMLAAATHAAAVTGAPRIAAPQPDPTAFCGASDIPLIVAFRTHDRVDTTHPTYCGDASFGMPPHVRRLMAEADVVLAMGVRFGETLTDGYTLFDLPAPRQKVIHVHVSDRELGKIIAPLIGLHADPNATAQALHAGGPVQGAWSDWRAAGRAAYQAAADAPPQPGTLDMGLVMRHLATRLPSDTILTGGAGNYTIWPGRFFPFGPGHRYLAPQAGAMGYSLPAGIAAKLAHPDRTVVTFAGDGEIQMTLAELGTAVQAGAVPVVLVVNNGTYATIRMHQERRFPGRVSGTDLHNPDFSAVARAWGLPAERITHTADFAPALDRVLAAGGGLIELVVDGSALNPRETVASIRAKARG